MNRRDLLKFFGIGATITPVANGAPIVEAAAKLLTVPEIAPVVLASEFPDGHESSERYRNRLKWNPYENIWLKCWQIENNPPSFLNYGIGPLEHTLGRPATLNEKRAVASVMQWLGTNCGHAFVAQVLEASGYKLQYDYDHPIKKLQSANVWLKPADSVEVKFRGVKMVLSPNSEGEVIL